MILIASTVFLLKSYIYLQAILSSHLKTSIFENGKIQRCSLAHVPYRHWHSKQSHVRELAIESIIFLIFNMNEIRLLFVEEHRGDRRPRKRQICFDFLCYIRLGPLPWIPGSRSHCDPHLVCHPWDALHKLCLLQKTSQTGPAALPKHTEGVSVPEF